MGEVGFASAFRSVPDLWHHRVGSTPGAIAMRFVRDGVWHSWSWAEAAAQVRAIANGLLSLGVKQEEPVVLLAGTSADWVCTDIAIMCAGAATTTLFPSITDQDLALAVSESNARIVFVDTVEQVQRLLRIKATLPTVERVICFDSAAAQSDGWVTSLQSFVRVGRDFGAAHPEAYAESHKALREHHTATIIYTSGATGRAKGVVLTHDAWVFETEALDALQLVTPADVQLLCLPLAHVFARVLEFSFVRLGIPTAIDGRMRMLPELLATVRPTYLATTPQILERLRKRILGAARDQGGLVRRSVAWALEVGDRFAVEAPPSLALRTQHSVADRLLLGPLRERLGGRLRFFISGGGPLGVEEGHFFRALGVPVLEGYGLTETSGATCVNRIDDVRIGTVGPPVLGCDLRIADDGEILVKSRGVTKGYLDASEATEALFDDDGFLKTGDIGLLVDGHLQITGRKRDIIVTSGGKNVAPIRFESRLRGTCPYVAQVLVHGDRRPWCTALLTLNQSEVVTWAHEQEVAFEAYSDLVRHPQLRSLLQGYVDAVNRELSAFERVRRFAVIVEPWTEAAGLVTPSQKLRRSAIEARYWHALEELYTSEAGSAPTL
ncbi:MAG: long-chain fatty acid--CoA ligase [Myxococcota bacterium]